MDSMDIYSPPGTKVRYTGENGTDFDHKHIQNAGISVGDILTVAGTEVEPWHSYVHFVGIKSRSGFNTVCFVEANQN